MDVDTAEAMAAGLGADVALEIVGQIEAYVAGHTDCRPIGVDVVNHGGTVEIRVRHEGGCPAVRGSN